MMADRLSGLSRPVRLALPFALGAVAGLGQVPFGLPWATLVALAALIWLGLPPGWRAGFARGWLAGFGYFLVTIHWIFNPFLVDPDRHGWMAPFGLIFMTGGLALFWGAAFAGATALRRPLALVPALAAAELLRSYIFTGFPWALVGHVWIGSGLGQTAALWGAQGLTLVTLVAAGLVAVAAARPTPAGKAMAALPLLAVVAADLALAPGPAPQPDPGAPVIRLVQPNVAQADKDNPDQIPHYSRRLLDLSAEPDAPDLVVWPETALPWLLDSMTDVLPVIAAAGQGAPVVLGVMRDEGPFYYNSLVLLQPDGSVAATYDKHHLVPFGEYVPFGDLMARFGIRGLAAAEGGGYAAGTGPAVIAIPGIGTAMPLICYETIFPQEILAAPERPRFLMVVTNDAWFGRFAGPYQHLALGRLRAIETGLPMVRAANTGVSAVIDARGGVVDSLPLGNAGRIDAALPAALPPTPYSRSGDWPVAALIAAWLVLLVARRRSAIDPGLPER